MDNNEAWRRLLREALAILALPPDEQVRVNGPGCISCDLLNDFDHARTVAVGNANLSDAQARVLEAIDGVMRSMQAPDFECYNVDVLHRPVWHRLRELAADSLQEFGWTDTVVEPYIEVKPGLWHRRASNAE